MSAPSRRILMVAGEASGDLYGSHLTRALREQDAGWAFRGIGGPRMREVGVDLFADSSEMAVVGLTEVLAHWKPIRAAFTRATLELTQARPDLLLLIDYPDFNLRLARKARQHGIPVVYFISPQIWAWRKSRIHDIARTVSLMLVILPFEEALYREAGVPVQFVGHPLLDILPEPLEKRAARAALGLDPGETILGLMPGSRLKELRTHLPIMLECARLLRLRIGRLRCLIPLAATLRPSDVAPLLEELPSQERPLLVENRHVEALGAMDAAVIKSGTATLEAALMGVPMVVGYRTSPLTYALASWLADVPHVALVNIVSGERLVPELVQNAFQPPRVAALLEAFLNDPDRTRTLRDRLLALRAKLGAPGCFRRAAEAIHRCLAARDPGRAMTASP